MKNTDSEAKRKKDRIELNHKKSISQIRREIAERQEAGKPVDELIDELHSVEEN